MLGKVIVEAEKQFRQFNIFVYQCDESFGFVVGFGVFFSIYKFLRSSF